MKSAKIFISDEGYGPIVRQSAVISELIKIEPNLKFDIQTEAHFESLRKIIPIANPIRKFNNIKWEKNEDGSPDLQRIEQFLLTYPSASEKFIREEPFLDYDFIISDFVYEAFKIYKDRKIPVFGLAHFTWDWFFAKLFPPVLTDLSLIKNWIESAKLANSLFFPPFTPIEILKCYKGKAIEVPFIVRNKNIISFDFPNPNLNILIIDSGSKVNHQVIQKIIEQISGIIEFNFYMQDSDNIPDSSNIITIPKGQMLSDYIPHMDLVIGRAGFNTISECIASRIPMMLFSEHMNPEMNENILNMNGVGFGTFIKLEKLIINTKEVLFKYFDGDYNTIKYNLQQHDLKTNGAEIVANYIANEINL